MRKLFIIFAAVAMMMVVGCKQNGASVEEVTTEVVAPADTLAQTDSLAVDCVADEDCECETEQSCEDCGE